MEAEVRLLLQALTNHEQRTVAGVCVHSGLLEGVPMLVAQSGVGKVNAALATVALHWAGADQIVFSGVAGGVGENTKIGDIVVATRLVQHDVDVTALGKPAGVLLGEPQCWPVDEQLSHKLFVAAQKVCALPDEKPCESHTSASALATVHQGVIASGDQFIASKERSAWIGDTFNAVAVEMEGAATAQVCNHLQIPCAVVRSLSDGADESSHTDFPAFLEMASQRGLALIKEFAKV